MKLTIEKSEFFKRWQLTERITDGKHVIPTLGGVLCTSSNGQVVLSATDLKTSIRCAVQGVVADKDGSVLLPAKLLGELFKKLPTNDFTITINEEKGTLASGKNKTKFSTWDEKSFPKIPSSGDQKVSCKVGVEELHRVVSEGTIAGSNSSGGDNNFMLYSTCCLLKCNKNVLTIVTTDGSRFALSTSECDGIEDFEVVMPVLHVRELIKLLANAGKEDVADILVDGAMVWFKIGDIEFSIRRVETAFPGYDKILKNDIATEIIVDKPKFMSAVERVEIIAKGLQSTTIPAITITATEGVSDMKLYGRSATFGEAEEFVDCEVKGKEMKLGYNISFILSGLKAIKDEVLKLTFGEDGKIVISSADKNNFLYITMPMNLTSAEMEDGA